SGLDASSIELMMLRAFLPLSSFKATVVTCDCPASRHIAGVVRNYKPPSLDVFKSELTAIAPEECIHRRAAMRILDSLAVPPPSPAFPLAFALPDSKSASVSLVDLETRAIVRRTRSGLRCSAHPSASS